MIGLLLQVVRPRVIVAALVAPIGDQRRFHITGEDRIVEAEIGRPSRRTRRGTAGVAGDRTQGAERRVGVFRRAQRIDIVGIARVGIGRIGPERQRAAQPRGQLGIRELVRIPFEIEEGLRKVKLQKNIMIEFSSHQPARDTSMGRR